MIDLFNNNNNNNQNRKINNNDKMKQKNVAAGTELNTQSWTVSIIIINVFLIKYLFITGTSCALVPGVVHTGY